MIVGISGAARAGKDTTAGIFVRLGGPKGALPIDSSVVQMALADEIKRTAAKWWGFSEMQLWGPSDERNKPDERYFNTGLVRSPVCDCLISADHIHKMEESGTRFWIDEVDTLCAHHRMGDDPEWYRARYWNSETWPEFKHPFLTPRHALQQIGTEVARSVDKNLWVRIVQQNAKCLMENLTMHYLPSKGLHYSTRRSSITEMVVVSDVRFQNEINAIREGGGYLIRVKRGAAGLQGGAAKHASEAEMNSIPDEAFNAIIHNEGTLDDLETMTHKIFNLLIHQPEEYRKQHAKFYPDGGAVFRPFGTS